MVWAGVDSHMAFDQTQCGVEERCFVCTLGILRGRHQQFDPIPVETNLVAQNVATRRPRRLKALVAILG